MLKSLYSGVSGVRSNQTKLDVVGNNIANVNTTAYKSSRVNFKDMLSQTLRGANEPSNSSGGLNPKQVGLGVTTGSITSDNRQGTLNETGRPTDLALEGDGYFTVSDATKVDIRYTRDGSFTLDKNGNLVTSDGFYIMGEMNANISTGGAFTATALTATSKITDNTFSKIYIPSSITVGGTDQKLVDYSIEKDGNIKAVYGDTTYSVGKIILTKFVNPSGLTSLGGNSFRSSLNSGDPELVSAGTIGNGQIRQGMLEMSNVDLAGEMTDMLITSRSFQANSKVITTSDEMLQELLNLKR